MRKKASRWANGSSDSDRTMSELTLGLRYITRFGGTVTNVDEWGKKRLAYEIQKSHEAYYYFIQFESDSVCPNEVEAHVRRCV